MFSPPSFQPVDASASLLAAVTDIAENSLFTFAEACDRNAFEATASASDATDWLRASVRFTGPFAGRLELTAPRALLLTLCATFAGAETADDFTESDLSDFTGELANMICGAWFTRARRHQSFALGVPLVHVGGLEARPPEAPCACITQRFYVAINETPIEIAICSEDPQGFEDEGPGGR